MGIEFEFFEAGHGDSIFVFTDTVSILIDGGDSGTSEAIEDFLEEKGINKIDLAILTHIDKDHIMGLIELLDNDVQNIIKNKNYTPLIKEVWFNSFKNTSNKDDEIFIAPRTTNNQSINHHITFTKLMKSLNGCISYKNYLSTDSDQRKFQIGDVEIILLSPNERKLDALYKKYKKKIDSNKNLSASSYSRDSDKSIEELYSVPFSSSVDSSVSNGSSIAFILIYKEKNFLFLGDAHIGLVIEELEKYKKEYCNDEKIKFEFIKLSHHGSRNNIHKRFLELVDTNNYVILTDSKGRNRHPDKETLSKIIIHHYTSNPFSTINFVFNYTEGAKYKRYDFSNEDLNQYGKTFKLISKTSYPWTI